MKKSVLLMLVTAVIALGTLTLIPSANAAELKMVGVITSINIDGKSAKTATVNLKDTKTDKVVTVTINDELTLDKFKDHRIVEGDEIRLKYEVVGGKNVSKIFRKTAGC